MNNPIVALLLVLGVGLHWVQTTAKQLWFDARHLFYSAKDGKWYCGYSKDVPSNHRFISYYSDWYDGYHRALWVWRFTISNSY